MSNFKITSLDLDSKLKGTITFAFYYEEGIMVGVDSRSSNEWRPENQLKSKLTSYTISIFFLFLDTHHDFMFKCFFIYVSIFS